MQPVHAKFGSREALVVGVLACAVALAAGPLAAGTPYVQGDIFAGVGGGFVKHFKPDGTLVQTLDTTSGASEDLGMCFDAMGNLYTTNSFGGTVGMSKFDSDGDLIDATWGSGFNTNPESCSISQAQIIYVGQPDGSSDVLKFDTAGTLLDSYDVATQSRGSDWVDLAADQCTLFYTSEGSSVKRYDVCADTQLADFATGLTGGACYALRIRTNGEVMVACTQQVHRLNSSGTVMQTYPNGAFTPSPSLLFGLNVDPDGTSFWTADYFSGNIYRMDIASGNQLSTFNASLAGGRRLSGLALFGEATVGQPTPTPGTPPPTATPQPTATPTPPSSIPTVGSTGLMILVGLLALAGILVISRRF